MKITGEVTRFGHVAFDTADENIFPPVGTIGSFEWSGKPAWLNVAEDWVYVEDYLPLTGGDVWVKTASGEVRRGIYNHDENIWHRHNERIWHIDNVIQWRSILPPE